LGISGSAEPLSGPVVDPEALVLITCSVGRYDARLFDEVMDWIAGNWELINVSRLNHLRKKYDWQGADALGALADWMNEHHGKETKWSSLVGQEQNPNPPKPFFLEMANEGMPVFGEPEPVFARHGFHRGHPRLRGYSRPFSPDEPSCLALTLRSFFGTNVRADIMVFLLTNPKGGHPSGIAREISYHQKTVQNALTAMNRSGLTDCRETGREKIYSLNAKVADAFLAGLKAPAEWIAWGPVYCLLERAWAKLRQPGFDQLSADAQAVEVREAIAPLVRDVSHTHVARMLSRPMPPRDLIPLVVQALEQGPC
jgi:hypothetical protein